MTIEPEAPATSPDEGVYVISVAAELLGVHPQTLRAYERRGLLNPARTEGGTRLYSSADVAKARRVIELSNEGLTHSGISRILALEDRVARLSRPSVALVPLKPHHPGRPPTGVDSVGGGGDGSKGVL